MVFTINGDNQIMAHEFRAVVDNSKPQPHYVFHNLPQLMKTGLSYLSSSGAKATLRGEASVYARLRQE
jgi:hypothetical protein